MQLAGVAVIIAGVVLATAGRRRRPYTEAELRDVAQPGSAPALEQEAAGSNPAVPTSEPR